MRHRGLALALLAPGLLLSYVWQWVPDSLAGYAWNISTALMVVLLLALIAIIFSSPEVLATCALLALLKLSVIVCDVWHMVAPWPVQLGEPMCSSRLNLPLGVVGLALGAILATAIYRGRK